MDFKWFFGIDISKLTLDITLYNEAVAKQSKHIKKQQHTQWFVKF